MTQQPHPLSGLQMELPEDLAPIYSNTARISHTPFDFTLDFTRILPADPKVRVLARLIMSPVATKLFLRALTEPGPLRKHLWRGRPAERRQRPG